MLKLVVSSGLYTMYHSVRSVTYVWNEKGVNDLHNSSFTAASGGIISSHEQKIHWRRASGAAS